jgi:biotin operon repressor
MAAAVEDQGLEISQYREIGYLLENDADLPDRLDRVAAGSG